MKIAVWNDLPEPMRAEMLARPPMDAADKDFHKSVQDIITAVRQDGDDALRGFAQRFDNVTLNNIAVPVAEIAQAAEGIETEAREAIDAAFATIKMFHEHQGYQPYSVETRPGVVCQRTVRPVERVGLYVPGGTAPLISTALMLGVPSLLAGCPVRIMCTPCSPQGRVNPHILYAAKLCGIEQVFRAGGAQAIAAMAYGTQSVPKVDKIFGPGSARVTLAKTLVAQDALGAAIDMPAGPSEVCVIATDDTNPVFAAADLLAQAEHDTAAHVVLIAFSEHKVQQILQQMAQQLPKLPSAEIAAQAIKNSVALIAQDKAQALHIANEYAPEHLILCFDEAESWLPDIKTAGSVFLGPYTPETAGDYASGTNHVLPTYGYARAYAGLSVEQFQRSMTVQSLTEGGLKGLAPSLLTLARLEGLEAHAQAVLVRLKP